MRWHFDFACVWLCASLTSSVCDCVRVWLRLCVSVCVATCVCFFVNDKVSVFVPKKTNECVCGHLIHLCVVHSNFYQNNSRPSMRYSMHPSMRLWLHFVVYCCSMFCVLIQYALPPIIAIAPAAVQVLDADPSDTESHLITEMFFALALLRNAADNVLLIWRGELPIDNALLIWREGIYDGCCATCPTWRRWCPLWYQMRTIKNGCVHQSIAKILLIWLKHSWKADLGDAPYAFTPQTKPNGFAAIVCPLLLWRRTGPMRHHRMRDLHICA